MTIGIGNYSPQQRQMGFKQVHIQTTAKQLGNSNLAEGVMKNLEAAKKVLDKKNPLVDTFITASDNGSHLFIKHRPSELGQKTIESVDKRFKGTKNRIQSVQMRQIMENRGVNAQFNMSRVYNSPEAMQSPARAVEEASNALNKDIKGLDKLTKKPTYR